MAEFCESCPLKGQCVGEIETHASGYVDFERRQAMGRGPLIASYHGEIGAFIDEFGNPSNAVYFVPNRTPEQMVGMVENCDGPIIETRGIIRKRNYAVGCSALGKFACNEPELKQYLNSQLR